MIKYSKNNELKPSERVDPCFNIIVGGVHINMLGLGAIAIDLIFRQMLHNFNAMWASRLLLKLRPIGKNRPVRTHFDV